MGRTGSNDEQETTKPHQLLVFRVSIFDTTYYKKALVESCKNL
jgi:hypothetical protein